MKITGHEFNEWYQNHWPGEDWYHEDYPEDLFDAEGNLADPDATYDTDELGYLCWQGPYNTEAQPDRTVTQEIRRWRKCRDEFVMCISGPKGEYEKIKHIVVEAGCKLL